MKKLTLTFGNIWIDTKEGDDKDYIYIVDSYGRFLDKFSRETFYNDNNEFDDKIYDDIINSIQNCQTVKDLFNYLCINYHFITKDLKKAYDFALKIEYIEKEDIENILEEKSLLKNEWINKIGNHYIFVEEY